jgi:hypothetical protein
MIRIVGDGRRDERPSVDDRRYGVNPSASSRSSASRAEKPFSASLSPSNRRLRSLTRDEPVEPASTLLFASGKRCP